MLLMGKFAFVGFGLIVLILRVIVNCLGPNNKLKFTCTGLKKKRKKKKFFKFLLYKCMTGVV